MSKYKPPICLLIFILVFILFSTISCSKKSGQGMPPPVVSTTAVTIQNWQTEINAIGTLSASQGVVIKPEVGGRITGIFFHSGDYVKANAPLIQINPDILNAQLIAAEAKMILTKANYDRVFQLYGKRVSAKQDLDTATANYRADEAAVAQYQALLNQTLVKAPFEGRLGLRLVSLGDYLSIGDPITNIQDLEPLRIDFSVPEIYLGELAVGQTVFIRTSAYPNQVFQGQVYAFNNTIDPNTRSLAMRASTPNKDHKLLPGIFVEVTLLTGKPQHLITIPETALSYEADGTYVYKVLDNMAIKSKITTGQHKNNQVAVLKGLNPKDIVVTAGQFKIVGDKAPVIAGK